MIRLATADDIEQIAELGREMVENSNFAPLGYDIEHVKTVLTAYVDTQFVAVYEVDDAIVGYFIGTLVKPWFTKKMVGYDSCFYLKKEHRNGRVAIKMVKAFDEWCKSLGGAQIRLGTSSGDPSVERLYSHLGHQQVGHTFLKEL